MCRILSLEEIPVLWIGKASKLDQERVVIAAHLTPKKSDFLLRVARGHDRFLFRQYFLVCTTSSGSGSSVLESSSISLPLSCTLCFSSSRRTAVADIHDVSAGDPISTRCVQAIEGSGGYAWRSEGTTCLNFI